jgi:transcriptional antiterminator NusG
MGRIREVEAPLFPGYLFCRFDFGVGPRIVTTPGFVRVVGFGKTPTPVEASEIRAVQTMIQSGLLVEPHPFLRIGQRVRLLDGPLSGLEGILVRIKNSHRLVVSVTLLQRSLAVEIETDWAASAPFMPVAVAS